MPGRGAAVPLRHPSIRTPFRCGIRRGSDRWAASVLPAKTGVRKPTENVNSGLHRKGELPGTHHGHPFLRCAVIRAWYDTTREWGGDQGMKGPFRRISERM